MHAVQGPKSRFRAAILAPWLRSVASGKQDAGAASVPWVRLQFVAVAQRRVCWAVVRRVVWPQANFRAVKRHILGEEGS